MLDIATVADPWVVQAPWMTPQQIKENLYAQVEAGIAKFFWSHDGRTCWFLRRCTDRVADVHLFSDSPAIIASSRQIQRDVWEHTSYQKLEMRTHIKGVCALARRLGWRYEGTRHASIVLADGSVVDEQLYGILK